jgi:GxxExxY protein
MATLRKYSDVPADLNALSEKVVDCIFQVHKNLGAGFLEKIYEDCLCTELQERGIAFTRQFPISLTYKGKIIASDFRLDLVVEDKILLELKAVEKILPVHEAQIFSYLRMAALPLGFLVNFNVPLIKEGIRRFAPKNLRNSVTPCQIPLEAI